MSILFTIITGLIVGLIARFVLPGKQQMGLILTAALGVGGSLAASYLGQAFGWYTAGQGAGLIASVIGAVILLLVVGKLRSSSGSSAS